MSESTRLLSGNITDVESAALSAQDDKDFLPKYSLSHFMGEKLGTDPEDVFNSFDDYYENVFGDMSLDRAVSSSAVVAGVKNIEEEPQNSLLAETGKSLARGTVSLAGGGVTGLASLVGADTTAFELAKQTKESTEALAPNLATIEELNRVKRESGTIAQLFTPEWYATTGAEMIPNLFAFGGTGAVAFKGASLLFKAKKLQFLATAASLGTVEGGVESGAALVDLETRKQMAEKSLQFLEGLPDEIRDGLINEGVMESSSHYQQIIDAGSNPDVASAVAADVFQKNIAFNAITNSLGLGFGKVAVSKLFSGINKKNLPTILASFTASLATEPEQELRQDEFIDSSILENVFKKSVDNNLLSSRLYEAITGTDQDKKDTALAAFIMGARNPIVTLASDISESGSVAEAAIKIQEGLQALRSKKKTEPQDVDAEEINIPDTQPPIPEILNSEIDIDALDKEIQNAGSVGEQVAIIQQAAQEINDRNIDLIDEDLALQVEERRLFEEEKGKQSRELALTERATQELTDDEGNILDEDGGVIKFDADQNNNVFKNTNNELLVRDIQGQRATVEEAQKRLDAFDFNFKNVEIVESFRDLPFPKKQELLSGVIKPGEENLIQGMFSKADNKVFILAGNIRKNDLDVVLLHEIAGHAGLQNFFGPIRLNKMLSQVINTSDEKVQKQLKDIATDLEIDLKNPKGAILASEEMLAFIAENPRKAPNLFQTIIASIKQVLRDLGFTKNFSDNDIRVMLARARTAKSDGSGRTEISGQNVLRKDKTPRASLEDEIVSQNVGKILRGGGITDKQVASQLKKSGLNVDAAPDLVNLARAVAKTIKEDIKKTPKKGARISDLRKRQKEVFEKGFKAGQFTAEAKAIIEQRIADKKQASREEQDQRRFAVREDKRRINEKARAKKKEDSFRQKIREIKKDLNDRFQRHINDTQAFQKEAQKWMIENDVPLRERAKLTDAIRSIGTAKSERVRFLRFESVINRAQDLKMQSQKREDLAKLDRLIKKSLKVKKNKKGIVISPTREALNRISPIQEIVKMPLRDFDISFEGIVKQIEDLRSDNKFDEAADLESTQIDLMIFGALKDREPDVVRNALETFESILAGQREDHRKFLEERKARWDKSRNEITRTLGEVNEFDFQNERNKPKGNIARIKETLVSTVNKHLSLEQKLEKLADFDLTGGLEKITDMWRRFFWEANQQETSENRRVKRELDSQIRKIFNISEQTGKQELFSGNNADAKLAEISSKRVNISIKPREDGPRKDLEMNLGQALYVWLTMNQPQLSENMAKNGYDTETLNQLTEIIPQELIDLGKWMQKNLDSEYDSINAVYRKLHGADMPRNVRYFPFSPDVRDKSQTDSEQFNKALMDSNTMMNGALIARVRHNMKIDFSQDAISKFLTHKYNMNRFKAYAEGGKEFFAVIGKDEVKRTIRHNLGDTFFNELTSHAAQVMDGGNKTFVRNLTVGKLKSLFIVKALGGNLGVFFKQLVSFPAYWQRMSTPDFFKTLATAWTPEAIADYRKLIDTEFVQNRWNQGNHIEALFILDRAREKGWFQRAQRLSLITTRIGDLVPILIMGRTIYNQTFAEQKSLGKSDQEAAKMAEFVFGSMTEQTQQSSGWKDRTNWQRGGTLGEVFSMFQTSPRQYTTNGIRAIQRARKRGDRQSRLDAAKATFIFFGILPALFTAVTQLFNQGVLGRDDDRDDDEIWRDYMVDILKSPLTGMFLVRFMSDNLIRRAITGKFNFHGEDIAILGLEQDLINLFNAGYGIVSDEQEVIENLEKVFPAVKQGKEITQRIIK